MYASVKTPYHYSLFKFRDFGDDCLNVIVTVLFHDVMLFKGVCYF